MRGLSERRHCLVRSSCSLYPAPPIYLFKFLNRLPVISFAFFFFMFMGKWGWEVKVEVRMGKGLGKWEWEVEMEERMERGVVKWKLIVSERWYFTRAILRVSL